MIVRGVVTGYEAGKAVVVSDCPVPRSHNSVHLPGMSTHWYGPQLPSRTCRFGGDPIDHRSTWIPPRGETRLMVVSLPTRLP
jgi:hypothetical protein